MKKQRKQVNGVNVRELALLSLLEIREGRHSHQVLRAVLEKYQYLSRAERAFFTRLCEGTVEYTIRLDYVIGHFSSLPVRKLKPVIREILRMSVYQYEFMDAVPDAAIVNEAVKLAVRKGFSSLRGFVNGVLRRMMREWDSIPWPGPEDELQQLSVEYSMPEELLKGWLEEYGREKTCSMCRAFLEPSPTTVRFRRSGCDPEAVRHSLEEAGAVLRKAPYVENAWFLEGYDHLQGLQAFREGQIFVQDVSSMLAVYCAGIRKGDLVLDLCAAPGGKSLLAADLLEGSGRVIARDLTEQKTALIRENILRSGLENIEAETRDATVFDPEMEGKADVVLADLPCSGLGVIGRKPDIRYRVTEKEIRSLQILQRRILVNAIRYVRPGGTLLYSTCTVTPEENRENADWILAGGGMEAVSLDPCLCRELQSESTVEGRLQLLPGQHSADGFYIAKFRRIG